MAQSAAEVEAVNSFGWLADTIGLLGFGIDDLDQSGAEYIERMDRKANSEVREIPLSPVYALAQHHGVPTRLLDWTRRPEVAAYFSVREPVTERDSGHVTVWALNWHDTIGRPNMRDVAYIGYPNDEKIQFLVIPRRNSEYIHAQHGLLTFHADANKHFMAHGEWPAFEDTISESWASGEATNRPLRKVLLPRSEILELRRLLWRQETPEAHLMPSYDAVVRSLREKWTIE
jgi:hypothetical protein